MEIDIITDKTNSALKRRDVSIIVKSETTPSRVEVKNKIAALLDSTPELIVVNKLDSVFGKQETEGSLGIYEDEEHLKNVILGHIAGRDKVPATEEVPEAEGVETEVSEAAPAAEETKEAEEEVPAEPVAEEKEEPKEESTLVEEKAKEDSEESETAAEEAV